MALLCGRGGHQPRLVLIDEACERDEEQFQWEVGGYMAESSASAPLPELLLGKPDPVYGYHWIVDEASSMKHDPLDTGGISEEHNETGAGPDYQHPPINRKELCS